MTDSTAAAPEPLYRRHPIIYVRGFAASAAEIEDTVADPYMGFNLGSTKHRTLWDGKVNRFYFESPLIRLMEDHGYRDVYLRGKDQVRDVTMTDPVDSKCVVIHRYYDAASADFGTGKTPPIESFAAELSELILTLKRRVCENPANGIGPKDFRVYLVAHSMGGLLCRAFLQNKKLGSAEARGCVDKLFTYATPHNGIDLRIVGNVPGWATFGDADNFSRPRMAKYLDLRTDDGKPVRKFDDVSLVQGFDANKVFNLVGTNPADYLVLSGVSRWAAGDASDGLVRIENATTWGTGDDGEPIQSPSAYVHRSHSGYYGIVNSEEGYQNLTRFLFGDVRIDGYLDVDELTLPPEVEAKHKEGKEIRASYQVEVVVSVRGMPWQLHRRTVKENSAIFLKWDELFPTKKSGERKPDRSASPRLFSGFLDTHKIVAKGRRSLGFSVDLRVLVPDYQIENKLFFDNHYEGGNLYREQIIVEATPPLARGKDAWVIKYGFGSVSPNVADRDAEIEETGDLLTFRVPIVQSRPPGIKATLRVITTYWNHD
jgi:hypothetical protein